MADERNPKDGAQDLDDLTVLQRTDNANLDAEEQEKQGSGDDAGEDMQGFGTLHTGSQRTQDEVNNAIGAGAGQQSGAAAGAEDSESDGTDTGPSGNRNSSDARTGGQQGVSGDTGSDDNQNSNAEGQNGLGAEGNREDAGASSGNEQGFSGAQRTPDEPDEEQATGADQSTSGGSQSGGGTEEEFLQTAEAQVGPQAGNDEFSLGEDSVATFSVHELLANDADGNNDILVVTAVGDAAHGIVSWDPETGQVTYTPDDDYNGPDSFTYTVSDGNGGFSTATVNLTIDPENDNPVTVDDVFAGSEDNVMTFSAADLLANDSDVDLDNLSVDSFTQPANGTLTFEDGVFTFTPNENWNGETSFDYTIVDGQGGSATGSVSLDVAAVNDGPVAVDDVFAGSEDNVLTFSAADLLENDSDVDLDSLSVDSFTQPANGTLTFEDGVFTFTPNENWNGETSFDYTIVDGQGGSATGSTTLEIAAVNDGPVAVDDVFAGSEDNVLTFSTADLLENDSDVDLDSLSVDSFTQPANGTLTFEDGVFTFTPNENWNGETSFDYTIVDGQGGSATGSTTLEIAAVNDGPEASADSAETGYREAVTIDVLDNDSDLDGDSLSISAVNGLSNGTVQVVDGKIVYTPNDEFSGQETFSYTVTDGNGGSETATVTVDVAAGTVFSDEGDTVNFNEVSAEDYQDGQQYASGDGDDVVTLAGAAGQAEHGFDGGEQFSAGAGNDTVTGGDGADNIDGGVGNDVITGGAGGDTLAGGEGDDNLTGGADDDVIQGGEGSGDTANFSGNRADYTVISNEDGSYTIIDNVAGRDGTDQVWGVENFSFADGPIAADDLIPEEMFTENNDTVNLANADPDYGTTESYDALDGDDTVTGGDQNDVISGGAGNDNLDGGAGNDTLRGDDNGNTLVVRLGGESYNGDPHYRIVVDGETLAEGDVTWSRDTVAEGSYPDLSQAEYRDITVTLPEGTDPSTIQIMFTNDAYKRNVGDRNLIVDRIVYNGEVIEAETAGNYRDGGRERMPWGGTMAFDVSGKGNAAEAGNDTLSGGAGDDTLLGGGGDDVLNGGAGSDTIVGGAGSDTFVLSGNYEDYTITENEDGSFTVTDTVDGRDGSDTISGVENFQFSDVTYTSEQLVELAGLHIVGDNNANDLNGGAGGDTIEGLRGHDEIHGGAGDDTIDGDHNNDTLYGGEGNDIIDGGNDNDTLFGGEGDDHLRGGHGTDTLNGGVGNDTFYMEGRSDYDANDVLNGGDGTDTVKALNDGDMTFSNFTADNSIEVVDGGNTESRIRGDNNDNILDFSNTTFTNIGEIDGERGDDTITGTAGDDSIDGGDNDDILFGGAGSDNLYGGAHDDTLYGGDGADTLRGGHGTDTLDGGDGDDVFLMEGRSDRDAGDVLYGGAGTDTVRAENDGDMTFRNFTADNSIEVVDGGNSASRILGDNNANTLDFSNATLNNIREIDGGRGSDTITGSSGDDSIDGGDQSDTVYGGAGNDSIDGGAHDDTLYGGDGNDIMRGGHGTDTLIGGDGDDTFVMEGRSDRDADDVLEGGAGTDTVMAGNDGDLYFNDFSADNSIEVVDGGNSASQIRGDSSSNTLDFSETQLNNISRIDAGQGDDTVIGSAGDDSIYGGNHDDLLMGGAGNDSIDGGAHDDTLDGGAGDDILAGGHGNDLFIFRLGEGNDQISGGDGWTDTVRVEGAEGAPGEAESGWTLHLDEGEILEQGVDEDGKEYIRLTEDASGHFETTEGESVEFTGVERFEW